MSNRVKESKSEIFLVYRLNPGKSVNSCQLYAISGKFWPGHGSTIWFCQGNKRAWFSTSYDLFSLFGSYFFIQRFESDACLIF